jgi:hypothetical protein
MIVTKLAAAGASAAALAVVGIGAAAQPINQLRSSSGVDYPARPGTNLPAEDD